MLSKTKSIAFLENAKQATDLYLQIWGYLLSLNTRILREYQCLSTHR